MEKQSNLLRKKKEFPGGSGVRTLHAHCLGPRFDPSSRNQDPISHVGQHPPPPKKVCIKKMQTFEHNNSKK